MLNVELRDLPSVDELTRRSDDPLAVEAARSVLARAREEIRAGADPGDLPQRLVDELASARRPALRRVLNATGVIVHTNLGRAPLPAAAIERAVDVGRAYSNLEYDLAEGARGSRQDHVAALLRRLTGAEAAIVVNNNAAAMLLALAALAEGREVLVSRGELIEIGDGFRIPDVLARSGAQLVEVGTTNRTRAADYDRAATADAALLLRVHQSNFRVVGFAERPSLKELAAVARARGLPLLDDLGSGVFVDVGDEPTARGSLADGADLVCFSGDKLLGGPQAGIVVGRADLVDRLRRHPLHRALRIDKLGLAALEGTLLLYLDPAQARREVPVLRMLNEDAADVRATRRAACRTRGRLGRGDGRAGRRRRAAADGAPILRLRRRGEPRGPAAAARHAGDRDRPRRQAAARLPDARRRRDRRGRRRGSRMPLTVGTAGHIDHGKTWLVRALTGKDTDRLPEEQERGISIDLGYAPLDLGDGRRASLIDVPGHERLVRTMIAGATGIDLFLLVLDAQEGARPQTHEHLAVLRLLGVDRGVVAVTKADAVDDETLQLAVDEARELVPGAEVVPVSAKTGAGLEELRAALARVAVDERDDGGGTRLYVDRSFSLPGIGTVATGTLWSGRVAAGDLLRLEPAGRVVRVRSVQVHDTAVDEAEPGQRVAVNVPTLERGEIGRGDVLVTPGHYPVTYRLDVKLAGTPDLPAAATVHIGTNAVPARIARDGEYAQLRLVTPVVAARGDRVVLRTETTVGGGVVLDPSPPRRLVREQLELLDGGSPEEILAALVYEPVTGRELQARGILPPAELALGLASLEGAGEHVFSAEWLAALRDDVHARLAERARTNPLDPGLPLAELLPSEPWAPHVQNLLEIERRGAKAYLPGASAALGERAGAAAELEQRLSHEEIVKVDDKQLAGFLEDEGRLRRVGDGYAVAPELYDRGRVALTELDPITLAGFRDALGVGRRTAQLLLERYDADGLTLRRGDVRTLRRSRA